jgi:hypothetical protein
VIESILLVVQRTADVLFLTSSSWWMDSSGCLVSGGQARTV